MLSCWSKLAFQLPGSGSFYQSCTLSATNGSWTMAASVVVSSSAEASSRGVACFYEHKVAHPEVKPNHLVCDIFFTCKSSISTSLSTKTQWLMDVAAPRAGQHLKWESKTNHMAPLRLVVMWACWSALNHGCSSNISVLRTRKVWKLITGLRLQNNPSSAETSHAHLWVTLEWS